MILESRLNAAPDEDASDDEAGCAVSPSSVEAPFPSSMLAVSVKCIVDVKNAKCRNQDSGDDPDHEKKHRSAAIIPEGFERHFLLNEGLHKSEHGHHTTPVHCQQRFYSLCSTGVSAWDLSIEEAFAGGPNFCKVIAQFLFWLLSHGWDLGKNRIVA